MTKLKQRHQFYLPDDLSATLETLGQVPGSSKSAVVAEALRWSFENGVHKAPDRSIEASIDRAARVSAGLSEKLDWLTEALGMFVQHQLTIVAHQPPFTPEATHLGQLRYRAFIDTVGRKLAGARGAAFAFGGPVADALARANEIDGRGAQDDDDNARH